MLKSFAKMTIAAMAASCFLYQPASAGGWTVKVTPNSNEFGGPVIEVESDGEMAGSRGLRRRLSPQGSETIAVRYWERPSASTILALFERQFGQPGERQRNRPRPRRTPMKKLIIAVALVVASASPVLAEGFPNVYMTR